MRLNPLVPTVLGLVAVGVIACSDSTAPGSNGLTPTGSLEVEATADLAPSAGADIASDFAFMAGAETTAGGGNFQLNVPSGGSADVLAPTQGVANAWISPNCTFNAGTGRFVCPPLTRGFQTFTVSYSLADANGATQSAYDKVTTASINFIVTDSGATSYTDNGNTFADTILRRHNRTVSGLAGDPDTVHTWNGTGTGTVHSTRAGQIAKVYTFVANDTTTGVRFRQPRDINPYPLSGTVVKNYTVTRTREASDTTTHTTTRRVVVTFNGTVNVPMTINGVAYTLNLDTGKPTKQ